MTLQKSMPRTLAGNSCTVRKKRRGNRHEGRLALAFQILPEPSTLTLAVVGIVIIALSRKIAGLMFKGNED